MAKGFLVKALSLVTAASAVVAVSWAQPAFAATSLKYHNTEAQVDNNPGAGKAWVWVYAAERSTPR